MYLQSRLIQLWKQVNTNNTKKKKRPIQLGPQKMKDTIEIQNYVCSYFSMVNHTHLSSKILRSIRHVSNLLLKFWSPQYTSDAPLHSKTTSECVPWDFENTADFSTQRHTCPGCFCHTSQDESALWRLCIISCQRTPYSGSRSLLTYAQFPKTVSRKTWKILITLVFVANWPYDQFKAFIGHF